MLYFRRLIVWLRRDRREALYDVYWDHYLRHQTICPVCLTQEETCAARYAIQDVCFKIMKMSDSEVDLWYDRFIGFR